MYHHTERSSLAYRGWAIISTSNTFLPKIMEWSILLFREIYIWWCNRHRTVSSAFVIVLELYLSNHLTPRPKLLSGKYYSLKRKLKIIPNIHRLLRLNCRDYFSMLLDLPKLRWQHIRDSQVCWKTRRECLGWDWCTWPCSFMVIHLCAILLFSRKWIKNSKFIDTIFLFCLLSHTLIIFLVCRKYILSYWWNNTNIFNIEHT